MTEADIDVLRDLWGRLTGSEFSLRRLARRIHQDGGGDMSNLSEDDLIRLMEGKFHGDWWEPAFSFSELLAYYAAGKGSSMTKEQVVGWIAGAFVLADAISQNATDLELQFGIFFAGFLLVRQNLRPDECLYVLRRFLCRGK